MSTLVLHLGPHKTGTTSIQTGMAANAAVLADHGVVYDVTDDPAGVNHSPLAARFADDPAGAARSVAGWAEAPIRFVSSENFSYLTTDQWTALRNAVPDHVQRVDFVVFRRRRADAVHSQWAESVRWGETRSFPEWLLAGVLAPAGFPALDLAGLLQRLPLRDGDGLSVVDYDALRSSRRDFVAFMATTFLGLPPQAAAELVEAPERNESLPVATTELIRLLQTVHHIAGGTPGIDLFLAFQDMRRADPEFDALAGSVEQALAGNLIELDLATVDQLFEAADARYDQRWGAHDIGPAPDAPVADPPPPKPHLDQALLLEPAIRHALDRLHQPLVHTAGPGVTR